MPQRKLFVAKSSLGPCSANFLTFQHLHGHSHRFFRPVFVNPHRFGHDHLPKAAFPQGFTQRQPGGVNRRLTHSIWGRGAGSEIPELNIKTFQQLAAARSAYHMELMRRAARISFHARCGLFSLGQSRECLIQTDQWLNPAFKLPLCL